MRKQPSVSGAVFFCSSFIVIGDIFFRCLTSLAAARSGHDKLKFLSIVTLGRFFSLIVITRLDRVAQVNNMASLLT